MTKVFVLGIDGATPQLVLSKWIDELPTIKSLLKNAVYGNLASSIPPSTIIAWTSMLTGKDPSFSDVYSYTYKDEKNTTKLTTSQNIKTKRIWNYLDEQGRKSIILNVPLTYPTQPLNGAMISCFLTSAFNDKSIYPPELKQEIISKWNQDYIFDVNVGLAGYKDLESDEMIEKVYKMTDLQFKVAKDFMLSKEWDFFMSVVIGSDRLQHTMWRFQDSTHKNYPGKTKYENTIKDYFMYLDHKIADIKKALEQSGEDFYLIIASDHGFDKMNGRINLNDFLIKEKYLVLKQTPTTPTKLDFENIDWQKTKAYAIGAYFGRIFFNKKSRDPIQGILTENEIAPLQEEITIKLRNLKDDNGNEMQTLFFTPQEVYSGPYVNESPDLYVYFDNLRWGVNNDVANPGLYSNRTTKGSDDAGHAPIGLFLIYHKTLSSRRMDSAKIIDIFPTIFKMLKLKKPADVNGKELI